MVRPDTTPGTGADLWDPAEPLTVPVIAVFTKYDQFKRDVEMRLEDEECIEGMQLDVRVEIDRIFCKHYLNRLAKATGNPPYIRLESEACVNL
jgi:hypothetical protein